MWAAVCREVENKNEEGEHYDHSFHGKNKIISKVMFQPEIDGYGYDGPC